MKRSEPQMTKKQVHTDWFKRQRMLWVDEMLCVYGFINREHLCKKFGISNPQASIDLKLFVRENSEWVSYNQSTKRYEANKCK